MPGPSHPAVREHFFDQLSIRLNRLLRLQPQPSQHACTYSKGKVGQYHPRCELSTNWPPCAYSRYHIKVVNWVQRPVTLGALLFRYAFLEVLLTFLLVQVPVTRPSLDFAAQM
jgi:hypothetical protein